MNRISCLALALFLFSGSAFAQIGDVKTVVEAQSLTRAAPTLSSEGLDLVSTSGFRVYVCAEEGETLSGAGNLRAYFFDPHLLLWMRNPTLDLAVSASGVRCQSFPDVETRVKAGRVLFAADGVTVSGGTTVGVRVSAWAGRQ